MTRRELLGLAWAAPLIPWLGSSRASGQESGERCDFYELRRYQFPHAAKQAAWAEFLGRVSVPAWNRAGVQPVGLFEESAGKSNTIYVLLPHPSLESVIRLRGKLAEDEEYQRRGGDLLDPPKQNPSFGRIESWLLEAFAHMPRLRATEKKPSRIFELRTYESHSVRKAMKKIEMFNEGGEIEAFLEAGMSPVFFGRTVIGSQLPNLTYMLVFDDMADHDSDWKRFQNSARWKKLRAAPQYKDTVSHITRTFLRPLTGSQL